MISNGGDALFTFQVGIFMDKLDDLMDQRAVLALEREANNPNPIRMPSIFLLDPGMLNAEASSEPGLCGPRQSEQSELRC